MMSCKTLLRNILLICCLATLVSSCTTQVDYTMGSEFLPSNQKMELRRRVYEKGTMREGDGEVELCRLSSTRLYVTDSIASTNIGSGYFGYECSDTFGMRRSGFMTQMMFSLSLHENRGWGYRPIFDSMCLSLYVTDFHGDTTRSQRYEIYEIMTNDYLTASADSSFYISFDPTPYISKEPIFTFDFPDQARGVYVGDVTAPQERSLRLNETSATRQYIERLMFLGDLEANNGFALDADEIYVVGNEAAFLDKVHGVYITAADEQPEGRGATFATELESTAMLLYARDRYEEDPAIIRDTTNMVYNFYLDPDNYDLEVGNVSINKVEHDFSVAKFSVENQGGNFVVNGGEETLVCYVDGMGGVVTELQFSDEFIQSLADIVLENKESVVAVNQAHLSIYLEGSDYDYMMIDPMYITPILDSAMPRLGLYTDYADLIAVSDYLYSVEANYTIDFDGTLNRSLACYTMNISGFVQSLMNAAADNVDENGVVKLEKFAAGYEPASESLVSLRRAYIAPDAYSLFGLERQAINGSDGDVGGERCTAPIKLDMTYTIVN